MHLKFWRTYGLCPRCGVTFSWRRGRHPKHCDDCGYEYWQARYATILPQHYGKEALDEIAAEVVSQPFNPKGNEAFNEHWRALTEKRLGHTLPIMAKTGYGKRWKWSIHEEGK